MLLARGGDRTRHLFTRLVRRLASDRRVIVMAHEEARSAYLEAGAVEVCSYGMASPGRLGDVRRIEEQLGLSVYKAASNYLLYGRFVRSYGGRWVDLESRDEIVRAYVGAYDQLLDIFDRHRPRTVFYETLDSISSCVAFALARSLGVFGFEFRFSPFGQGRIFPAFGLFRRNVLLEHLYRNIRDISAESYAKADELLASPREHLTGAPYAAMHRRLLSDTSPFGSRQLRRLLASPKNAIRFVRNARWHVRQARNRIWLGGRMAADAPTGRYVLFYLQHLPEASSCSEAPRWVYQDAIIEQLAVNAPSDIGIVVKEHPRTYGYRGRAFWEPLRRLPNVTVCHPGVNGFELVSKAEAIVAVNGSVGLEGILLGKRVGVLGRSSYSIYPGVRLLDHPDEVFEALRDQNWAPHHMVAERRDFVAAHLQASFPFAHGEGSELYSSGGGDLWADALRKVADFVSRNELTPNDFESGLAKVEREDDAADCSR